MSEDTTTFTFANEAKSAKIGKMAEKVVAAYAKAGVEVEEVSGAKDGDRFVISLWSGNDTEQEGLVNALTYLASLPSTVVPYASEWLDQTGDTFHYLLRDGQLIHFDELSELQGFLQTNPKESTEQAFMDLVSPDEAHLMVRMKFMPSVKPMEAFQAICAAYVEDPSDESYVALKTVFDRENEYGVVDFPLMNWNRTEGDGMRNTDPVKSCSLGHMELGRDLMFCERNKSYLYLGFRFKEAFGIKPCKEGEEGFWARTNIRNKEGLQVLELLECLMLAGGEIKLQAKFHSPVAGQSGQFFSLPDADAPEYLPLWGRPVPPLEVWQS